MLIVRKPKIDFVTVVGRIYIDDVGYQRLLYIAWKYKYSLMKAIQMLCKGLKQDYVEKVITVDMNQGYTKSVIDKANLIVKSAEYYGKNPLKVKIKKLFIESKGRADKRGNQNIRLISTDELIVSYNFNGKSGKHKNWIKCDVRFGEEYLPLIEYIIKKANKKKMPYTVRILIKNRRDIRIHISIPTSLYTAFFSKGVAYGDNIASFDLNSDRINMIIVDRQGIIRDFKTEWYSEVNRPGYPAKRAWTLRLQKLGRLLDYAYNHHVGTVLFEDLEKIKRSNNKGNKSSNRNPNRKLNTFPKRKLLEHAVVMAYKYGFRVYLINPAYTTKLAEKLKDAFCLDRHTLSAYMLSLKYLNSETFGKLLNSDFQRRLLQP